MKTRLDRTWVVFLIVLTTINLTPLMADEVGQQTGPESPTTAKGLVIHNPGMKTLLPTRGLGDVYAVIIGIGDYRDERIPDLRFTINDAQGLYDVLIDPNYRGLPKDYVKLLLNEQATHQNIKRALGTWLYRQAKKEDTVLIYYSGHGATEDGDTYWVTYNADIDDLFATALNNNDIAYMLSRIKSKRVITFLDSCYSAATVNRTDQTKNVAAEIPWKKFSGEGRVAISASNGKQLSLELVEYQHGVFTYYLLEGLRGQADKNLDGVVEVDEIWDYVKYQVTAVAQEAGNPQTPVLDGRVTAGIPLTLNMKVLKQNRLTTLFAEGRIPADHFNRAYGMVSLGQSHPLLEGLLAGEISPEVFNDAFGRGIIPPRTPPPESERRSPPTRTPVPTATPLPTATPIPPAPMPTLIPIPTATPLATVTPRPPTPIPLPTATPLPTVTPRPPTPLPTATPETVFRVNSVTLKDAKGKSIDPVDGIYTLKAGETVTMIVDVTKSQQHRVTFHWTAGDGKLSPTNTSTTTYTSKESGSDYVLLKIEETKTGETVQKPLNLTIIP